MKSFIAILLLLVSCGQSYNSNSTDRFVGDLNIDISTPAGERLYRAYNVLQNQCVNCHSGYHNIWSSYNTDQQWISAGLVIKGEPRSSLLISRLQNEGSDMPLFAPQISEADYQALREWIEEMP